MRLHQRRAVSPIIATLLLIAIAVASGVIVYAFTGTLAGGLTKGGTSQVTQQIQLLAYNYQQTSASVSGDCSGTLTTGPCVILFLQNTGTGTVTVGSVYYDGTLVTEKGSTVSSASLTAQSRFELVLENTATTACAVSFALTTADCYTSIGASVTAGTSHSIKIVTSAGGTFTFNVVAGQTG